MNIKITLPDGTTWAWNGHAWLLDSRPVDWTGVPYIEGTICWPPR